MPQSRHPLAQFLRSGNFPTLPLLALLVMIVAMGIMQPRALSYIGLQLILRFALPIIFAALAQLCVITASDIDFGIGPFISLVNCIAATFLASNPVICIGLLAVAVAAYAAMGAFIQVRRLPSIVVTLGASFIWLGLALLIMPTPERERRRTGLDRSCTGDRLSCPCRFWSVSSQPFWRSGFFENHPMASCSAGWAALQHLCETRDGRLLSLVVHSTRLPVFSG